MGREFLDDALPVDIEREGVRVTGFAGLPTLHRPDPGQQYLFVNGRPVKDKLLIGAVRAAYGDLLPKGALSAAGAVRDARRRARSTSTCTRARPRCASAMRARVRALVAGALRQALEAAGHRATVGGRRSAPSRRWRARRRRPPIRSLHGPAPIARRPASRGAAPLPRGFAEDMQAPLEGLAAPSADARAGAEPAPADLLDRPLGAARAQLHETYIVAQTRASVVIVDQHAAHERLVYERLKAALANGGVARQVLLIPEIVELDGDEAAALAEAAPRAGRRSGSCVEAFGPGAVMVREVPALLGDTDVKGLVRDLAREAIERAAGGSLLEERAGGRVLDHGLPRQRARRAAADGGGDERAAARDGGDAALRPVQPRPPDLRRAAARRHRAAVRAAVRRISRCAHIDR